MKELSRIAQSIQASTTMAIDAMFKQMKADGVDVIGFGAGEPDFNTPDNIKEAGEAAIRDLRDATQKVEEECFEGFSMEEILLLKRFAMQIRDNLAKRMNDMPVNPKREGNLCSS